MPRKIIIAVVDDDDTVRDAVTGLVRSVGYGAVGFKGGDDFLDWNRNHRAACLIADVQMPGMTGPDLHGRLIESGNPIPTILIAAFPDEKVRARALLAGVKCYLIKPFDQDDLLECIRDALD